MKDIYSIDCGEGMWEITDADDGYQIHQHTELSLNFKIRFNYKNAGMIEFEIRDGDRFLGADAHYAGTEKAFQDWIATFIYKRQFVTWLSEKKVQLF